MGRRTATGPRGQYIRWGAGNVCSWRYSQREVSPPSLALRKEPWEARRRTNSRLTTHSAVDRGRGGKKCTWCQD